MSLPGFPSGFRQRSHDVRISESVVPGANGLVDRDEGGAVNGCAWICWAKIRTTATAKRVPSAVRSCAMILGGEHAPCQGGLIDNIKTRVVLYLRDLRGLCEKRER